MIPQKKQQQPVTRTAPWAQPESLATLKMNRDGSYWTYTNHQALHAVIGGQAGLPVTPNGGDITVQTTEGGLYRI